MEAALMHPERTRGARRVWWESGVVAAFGGGVSVATRKPPGAAHLSGRCLLAPRPPTDDRRQLGGQRGYQRENGVKDTIRQRLRG
jgi:hypothetical protein